MELEKQRLILNCLLSNRDLLAITSGIIKPSFFDPTLKKAVKFALDYFNTYKDIPKLATVRAETGLVLEDIGEISKSDYTYIANEVESFCKERAVFEAIMAGPELIDSGDYGKLTELLKSAVSIGLTKDFGIDYFDNPKERLNKTLTDENKLSTGWTELDLALGGGVARQELLLFAANSGGGKSMTMLNLARNFLAQGYNGVYFSLEMRQDVVSKRLDSMVSNVAQDDLAKELDRVVVEIEKAGNKWGKFFIKRMPENSTTVDHFRSYLKQLEQSIGFKPDFIVGDYIDIMGTTQIVSADNVFGKDKFVTEEFRSLGYDFDAVMISASQLNRGAIEAEKLNHAHIAGGISKINTSDYVVTVKQDDLMRAQGEIFFEIIKSRNSGGVGKRILLGWDAISLRIKSLKDGLPLNKKSKTSSVVLGVEGTKLDNNTGNDILNLLQ